MIMAASLRVPGERFHALGIACGSSTARRLPPTVTGGVGGPPMWQVFCSPASL